MAQTQEEILAAARAAGEAASKKTGIAFNPTVTDPVQTPSTTGPVSNDEFMSQLQNRLLNQVDIISSSDTQLEKAFSGAAQNIQQSQEASAQRITSEFDREIAAAEQQASTNIQGSLEQRRGFGTQMVAFRQLVETTDKNLKDLEQRKQELILQGESEAAGKLAELQVKAIEFRQKSQQDLFSNLLSVGKFAQSQEQIAQDRRSFNFQIANESFDRLKTLQSSGVLSSLSQDQLSVLEDDAGLPRGTADAMANVPPDREIRTVGDNIIAINPQTLESQIIYSGASSDANGVNIGGTKVSYVTSSVLNGLQDLDSLTNTDRTKVNADMEKLGFSSNTPPKWFTDKIGDNRNRKAAAQIGASVTSPIFPVQTKDAQQQWDDYKTSIVLGEQFINESYITSVIPPSIIEASVDEGGFDDRQDYLDFVMGKVRRYRNSGFSDKEIVDLMNF